MGENRTVTVLSGVKGDTRRYRAFHLFEQLQLIRAEVTLSHITDRKLPQQIARSALVIFQRVSFDRYLEKLFNTIQDQDILAISDVDDLIFDPAAFAWIDSPDFKDPLRADLYKEDMHRYRMTIERCQAALVSTHFLENQVRGLGLPVYIHRNAFSQEMLDISERAYQNRQANKGKIVIGYASGTPTHGRDFAVAKPALKSILETYPKCELHLYGPLDPGRDWGAVEDRVRRHPLVPWRELPYYLASFDINIAPLVVNNPFGQSKSEIKYIEAGLVRVPTIASNTDAYQYAIQPGVNGLLAKDQQDWTESFYQLIERADLRESMGHKAYEDIIDRYNPELRARQLVDTINNIYNHLKGSIYWEDLEINTQSGNYWNRRILNNRLSHHLERVPTLLQRGLYSLRYRGISTLLAQIWIYLRRISDNFINFQMK